MTTEHNSQESNVDTDVADNDTSATNTQATQVDSAGDDGSKPDDTGDKFLNESYFRKVKAERDELKEQLDDLKTQLDKAQGSWEEVASKHESRAKKLKKERDELKNELDGLNNKMRTEGWFNSILKETTARNDEARRIIAGMISLGELEPNYDDPSENLDVLKERQPSLFSGRKGRAPRPGSGFSNGDARPKPHALKWFS